MKSGSVREGRQAFFAPGKPSPGGQPSITQPMAGPCDSPNVVTVNSLPNELELTGAAPPVR